MKKKTINLSIVIPTLGENSLFHCIDSIKKNTFLPKEILLVIPRNLSYKIEPSFENENFIKIIKTEFQGQVIQKIHGFKLSKSKYVMQLDADILLERDTLKNLYNYIYDKKNSAVAPLLTPNISGHSKKLPKFILLIKNYIICGSTRSKPGVITDIGYNTWFELNDLKKSLYLVEWLPGGCILFTRDALILNNYYPFKNKAYCEDIIHSIYLTNKNVHLYFLPSNKVKNIGYKKSKNSFFEKIKEFKVRYYILKKIRGHLVRFLLWYLLYVIK
tara:strand:- start:197 stop:1015 length:819 start_codon:yes stop_codon:yes gene_type:complete